MDDFVGTEMVDALSQRLLGPHQSSSCATAEAVFFVVFKFNNPMLTYMIQNMLSLAIFINPVAFDGYPVAEIQAVGRASELSDDQMSMLFGAADQTFIQIEKTMTHSSSVYNQYIYRDLLYPYVDVDYNRPNSPGNNANSKNLRLKIDSLRNMADIAAMLGPHLLLPYHKTLNPLGVRFNDVTIPIGVIWGDLDNMMPAGQIKLFKYAYYRCQVFLRPVANAGHFATADQPDKVSETLVDMITLFLGLDAISDIDLGYGDQGTGEVRKIWKGDEYEKIDSLRKIFGIDVVSAKKILLQHS